jgi:hypothetical protein
VLCQMFSYSSKHRSNHSRPIFITDSIGGELGSDAHTNLIEHFASVQFS